MQTPASLNKRVGILRMASRVRKVFGTFENEPLLVRGHITSLGCITLPTTDIKGLADITNLQPYKTYNRQLTKRAFKHDRFTAVHFFQVFDVVCFFLFVDCGLLDVNEIDPIGRHLCNSANFHYGFSNCRYSSFKVNTILRLGSRVL